MGSSADSRSRAGSRQIEIGHFFSEGDGRVMLEALLDGFTSRHRDITVTDTAYGNTAHDLNIKSRILAHDPPDVFVEWPGRNLKPYVDAGTIMDISELWEENGLYEAFNDGARDLVSFDGSTYGVPITIHRKNNLFYNVELAEEYGINPRSISSPSELLEVLKQCHTEDIVGMAQPMKNPWTLLQLWSQMFIGEVGVEAYEAIAEGNVQPYTREIRETIDLLNEYTKFAHDNAAFQGMIAANDAFAEGNAVFFHQGDWVAGMYGEVDGFDYQTDWDHIPFPGTTDTYVAAMDSIVAPALADDPESSQAFLAHTASKDALKTINRIKGSIPPREDIRLTDFPPFLQKQYDDFNNARYHTGGQKSMVHPEVGIDQRLAFSTFMHASDPDETASALIEAYRHE